MIRADQILSSWDSYWVTKTASLPMSLPRPLYGRCHNIRHHWESQGLGRGQWASSSSPRIPFSFLLCAQIETTARPAQRWKYLGLQVHPTWNQQGGWADKALASQDWRSTPKPPLIRSIGRGSCDRQLPSLPSLSKDSSPSWPALGLFSAYAPHESLNKVAWTGREPFHPLTLIPDPWSPSGRAAVLISQQRKDIPFEKDSELVRMDQTPGLLPKPSDKYGELR